MVFDEDDLHCMECGGIQMAYIERKANGRLYRCKNCRQETVVPVISEEQYPTPMTVIDIDQWEPAEKNTTNAPNPAALHYADILDDIYHGISRINASGAAIELRRLHHLTEKLLLEKAQAENSTVMTLTDTLSDDECREVWTRYPEMRNWIQAHAINTSLPIATDWSTCQAIADHPEVDEALRLFADGETTSDQAVAIVQAVLIAVTSKDTA